MSKPFNPDHALEDLLSKRVIYLSGDITSEMASKFGKAVVWLNAQSSKKPIVLYIDSAGGLVSAGLDIYDMVRHSKAPITGIVYRRAYSMASVILQGCVSRESLPHAEILVHSVRLNELPLNNIEEDIDKALKKGRELQSTINEIFKNRTGLSVAVIKKMNRENKTISPSEALEYGLIDKIL